jgi:hypothetical protein
MARGRRGAVRKKQKTVSTDNCFGQPLEQLGDTPKIGISPFTPRGTNRSIVLDVPDCKADIGIEGENQSKWAKVTWECMVGSRARRF